MAGCLIEFDIYIWVGWVGTELDDFFSVGRRVDPSRASSSLTRMPSVVMKLRRYVKVKRFVWKEMRRLFLLALLACVAFAYSIPGVSNQVLSERMSYPARYWRLQPCLSVKLYQDGDLLEVMALPLESSHDGVS